MHDELQLLAIAGPPLVPLGRIVDACLAAEEGGTTAVQLRMKDVPASVMLETAAALRRRLSIPLWINDRADVALAAGARGVHVGADDIPPDAVREFAGSRLAIGISVGDAGEAEAARTTVVDYWSVGAIYATSTKSDAGAPIGIDGFRRLAARAPRGMPVIAIGGITEVRVPEVLGAGAQGVAVGHAIFASSDITTAARCLRGVIDEHRPE
jgi:thiamine-phosphate pyrophosphorylase